MTEEQIMKKEWLSRAKYTRNALEALERLKQEKIAIAESCGINYENDGAQNGSHRNGTEIKFLDIAEIEEKIEKSKHDLVEVYEEIEQTVYQLDNPEYRALLSNKYLTHMSWEETADKMGYSVRSIKYKHLLALDEILIS